MSVTKSAFISACGLYRYSLVRSWEPKKPTLGWIALNPSVADAQIDDQTVRRFIGFAQALDCGGIWVGNLFGLRATDPRELYKSTEPVGPENDLSLVALASNPAVETVICSWGCHGKLRGRDQAVRGLLERWSEKLHALAITKEGHPGHPLYLPLNLRPVKFPG